MSQETPDPVPVTASQIEADLEKLKASLEATAAELPVMASPPDEPEVREFQGTDAQAREFLGTQLYEPSLERLKAVTRNMITLTGSGDWAFWLPFAAIQSMLAELAWDKAPFHEAGRLLLFTTKGLRMLADRCEAYLGDLGDTRDAGAAAPPFPAWSEDLTATLIAEVNVELPWPELTEPRVAPVSAPLPGPNEARADGDYVVKPGEGGQ